VTSLLANDDPRSLSAAEDALALAREIGGPGALAEAAFTASRARQASGDLDGAGAVLEEAFSQLDPARMTVQRDVIARLETRRAEVALARGDMDTARTSAMSAVSLAPKQHVETRVEALLAMAAVAQREDRSAEARSLISEANAVIAPTEYRDLRERVQRMAELVSARAPAR
jgi:ATP/maltotriose-dependent transcriptional regulator MalT